METQLAITSGLLFGLMAACIVTALLSVANAYKWSNPIHVVLAAGSVFVGFFAAEILIAHFRSPAYKAVLPDADAIFVLSMIGSIVVFAVGYSGVVWLRWRSQKKPEEAV